MRFEARKAVAQNIQKDIKYFELDFQPPERAVAMKRKEDLHYQCRGIQEV